MIPHYLSLKGGCVGHTKIYFTTPTLLVPTSLPIYLKLPELNYCHQNTTWERSYFMMQSIERGGNSQKLKTQTFGKKWEHIHYKTPKSFWFFITTIFYKHKICHRDCRRSQRPLRQVEFEFYYFSAVHVFCRWHTLLTWTRGYLQKYA